MQNVLYHSTPNIGIKSLNPLSHLGTFSSALENYGRKFIDINLRARSQGRPYMLDHELLVCTINGNARSIGPIADWFSPAPMALLLEIYSSLPEIFSNEEYEQFKASCCGTKGYEKTAMKNLLNLFSIKNIHYVTYINNLEDCDSISICVIDPSILIIEERMQFTFDQIRSSVKNSTLYTNSSYQNFADELLGLLQNRG